MLEKGDTVRVTLPNGWWAEGPVLSTEVFDGKLFSVDLQKETIAYELPNMVERGYGYGRWRYDDGGKVEKDGTKLPLWERDK